jgi:hypothetical protein
MQIDKVRICNMALGNLGQPAIQSMTQSNKSAVACNQRYDEARLEALSGALWGFASFWSKPAAVSADPKPGWQYVHKYPNDALRIFEIYQEDKTASPIPFEVTDSLTGNGKWVHSNVETPTLIYTRDKEDVTTYDWDFIVALSWLLSSKIAMPVTKSKQARDHAEAQWDKYRSNAKARTKNEQAVDRDELASHHAARWK